MSDVQDHQITVSDAPVGTDGELLVEGHPDWRPWSGGHASPLEAMWQWMCRQGVGGLEGASQRKRLLPVSAGLAAAIGRSLPP